MNNLQVRFKDLSRRAKKVNRSLARNGNEFLLKIPVSQDAPIQKYTDLDKLEEVILGLEVESHLCDQREQVCEFQCFEIGGPWISENPFCPIHGSGGK